ncbi:MAG: hypothetical protein AMXMBFR33_28420 [Candidatus Xenobia bacterium]
MRRRTFLQASSAALALAALRPRVVLGQPRAAGEVLVVIWLRGGWDSLSAFVPRDSAPYRQARPNLAVPRPLELEGPLGLHPALAPLSELYQAGRMAVVPAAGLASDTRSHFQATAWMEGGIPGRSAATGWLARTLRELCHEPDGIPALAMGWPGQALQGYERALVLDDLDELDFSLDREDLAARLMDPPSQQALKLLRLVRRVADRPDSSRVDYPESDFGWQLSQAARLIRCPELSVRVVTLDLDGWDTHAYQPEPLKELLAELAGGLRAFHDDLQERPVTTVVMSEFGRQLAENGSQGTEHGRGGAMLALGPGIRGGLYGDWPDLTGCTDLPVTVDFRLVLAELLQRRLGCQALERIFPGFGSFQPLGLATP